MRRVDSPASWRVVEDVPELLQFAAFIGQQEAFSPVPSTHPRSEAEREWHEWWGALPGQIHAGLPMIDYPPLVSLGNRSALRALCHAHWNAFLQRWRLEKPVIIQRQLAQSRAVRVQDMVAMRERELGRSAREFTLRLDFTCWPEEYRCDVSESHLVLGRAFLEPSHLNELRLLVATRIGALA